VLFSLKFNSYFYLFADTRIRTKKVCLEGRKFTINLYSPAVLLYCTIRKDLWNRWPPSTFVVLNSEKWKLPSALMKPQTQSILTCLLSRTFFVLAEKSWGNFNLLPTKGKPLITLSGKNRSLNF
jgi:hypothetical protein